jgi:1-deoxy-D-xylulose-5-phosphate synthase
LKGRLLDGIDSPDDLKRLPIDQLPRLAEEIREEIIETVSHTGGHLASNLGAVELSIALNYIFDFKRDRVVWDVGHQSYTHKILTGRRDRFHSLRTYGGISGFPRPDESDYDHFISGHAGTAIPAALGMAVTRDARGDDYQVVAVVGDGSLTAGIALESLNQAGHLDRNMLIILNNNDMSISPNVGAISGYLNKIIHGRALNKLRIETELLLKQVPTIGPGLIKAARTVEHAIKRVFIPGTLFEELGLKYVGPLDGHNIHKLVETIERIRKLDGPVLVHVTTIKGKGYNPAEENPTKWHGSSPFEISTGNLRFSSCRIPSYTQVFGKTLCRLAAHDERIIAITAAMCGGTGLDEFAQLYPYRFFDVGIAEQFAVTFAAGMAKSGFKPVCAIYSTFLSRAFDQVFHDVCLQNLPVVFCIDRGGLVGEDGPTHHGAYDLSYLRILPNMVVMAPKDEGELRRMMRTALTAKHPVAIRYPRGSGVGVNLDERISRLKIGKGEVLRSGADATLIAVGSMVYPALRLAEQLQEKGWSLGVANARFIKPLDREMILELAQPGARLATLEENAVAGGFGSAVMELLEEVGLAGKVSLLRIGLPDEIIPHGSRAELLNLVGLDNEGLKKKILGFLKRNEI